jgi:hypothetical protein
VKALLFPFPLILNSFFWLHLPSILFGFSLSDWVLFAYSGYFIYLFFLVSASWHLPALSPSLEGICMGGEWK